MAENKTKPTEVSVAAFIDALPDESQARGRQGARQVDATRDRRKAEDVGAIDHRLRQLPLQVRERARGRYAADRFFAAQGRHSFSMA